MKQSSKMYSPVREEELVELIHTYKEKFYRIAYSYVKNEQDALDVIQESVYKAYCSLDKLKSPEYFKTWFTRILINKAIDQIRFKKRIVPLSPEHDSFIETKDSIPKSMSIPLPFHWFVINELEH